MVYGISLLGQLPNMERKWWRTKVAVANTDAQIAQIAWTTPANAFAVLEKMWVYNDPANAAGILKIFDADITTLTGTKPPARGSAANPLLPIPLPTTTISGNLQTFGYDSCMNLEFQAGICCQVTVQPVTIMVQYVEQIG